MSVLEDDSIPKIQVLALVMFFRLNASLNVLHVLTYLRGAYVTADIGPTDGST
jgi:hypothetical protein